MFKSFRLWLKLILSIKVEFKNTDLIVRIRNSELVITEQDVFINSQRYIGFNSSEAEILQNQQNYLKQLQELNTPVVIKDNNLKCKQVDIFSKAN